MRAAPSAAPAKTMPMHPNAQLIVSFYTAFSRLDAAGMLACYHADVHFSDPVFPDLHGQRAGAMWRMLCARARDLQLHFDDVHADDQQGRARWVATYTFSATGRRVENHIQAAFTFADGKILRHRDQFPLYRWTRMALGAKGMLLGWSPPVQNAIRKQAAANLEAFIREHGL
jgi:ketosteroid isomerase-like protein